MNKLALWRGKRGLTIKALALMTNLNEHTIIRLEKGKKGSLATVGKLAIALGIDLQELDEINESPVGSNPNLLAATL